MNIGFFINDVATERPRYATTCLAKAATDLGHTAWYIGVEDFACDPDDLVRARARGVPGRTYKSTESYLAALQGEKAECERITVADLDVLMLRSNPADETNGRGWGQSVGVIFGQLAQQQGVLVLNDPHSLANALNKLYFQLFPEAVRPRTLITRDRDEIRAFVEEQDGKAVLKPLQGSGGQGVFLVHPDEMANLNQIIEAISRDGYVVAQEYLPAAAEGDVRLFLMNGEPLRCEGKYAAFRRRNTGGDLRSNIHAGGTAEPAEIDEAILEIAAMVRPKLIQDGMFLVGLDIAGDKLMEVNVFSPGGLWSMEEFEGVPFARTVIEALEEKVAIRQRYGSAFVNRQLATM
ncbi:MAG: glutathione synthase [Rhodothermales bacterium]|nr:glutathione synthase [Rhodothermales bacterium]